MNQDHYLAEKEADAIADDKVYFWTMFAGSFAAHCLLDYIQGSLKLLPMLMAAVITATVSAYVMCYWRKQIYKKALQDIRGEKND